MFVLEAARVQALEVFTRLPDALRRSEPSDWGRANRGTAIVDSFLEGPVFDGSGRLYVCDIPWGRIFRIDATAYWSISDRTNWSIGDGTNWSISDGTNWSISDGTKLSISDRASGSSGTEANLSGEVDWTLIAAYDGEPNGMTFLNESELLITDYRRGLMVCDVTTGSVRPYLERRNSERFKGVNDLIFDSQGNLYFTDQGQTGLHDPSGRLYRLRPDGRLDLLLSNVPSPNGVALSPDERVLYLGVTRANQVWRVPLLDDGSVSKVGAFFTSYGPSGPDGLAVDERGRVIVANPGLGLAWVLSARAEPELILRGAAGSSLTNVAFGGVDRKTLFCTEATSGSILCASLEVAGLPVHRAR